MAGKEHPMLGLETSSMNAEVERCYCRKPLLKIQTSKRGKCKGAKRSLSAKVMQALGTLSSRNVSFTHDDDSSSATQNTFLSSMEKSASNNDPVRLCRECQEKGSESNKKEVPLLHRLRVVKATRSVYESSPSYLLPEEIIVQENDQSIRATGTLFSELGVDGVPSTSTEERRVPTRFTFDDVILSLSSYDDKDSLEGNQGRDEIHEEQSENILEDLRSMEFGQEQDDPVEHFTEILTPQERKRAVSSSEISIEYSESQHFRTCDVPEAYKIFSPRPSWERETPKKRYGDGENKLSDFPQSKYKDQSGSITKAREPEPQTSSKWTFFSFLTTW